MKKIKLTADIPSYLKVWEIEQELLSFADIIEKKYNSIDFVFWFCFRALEDDAIISGWKSKITFYKKDNALSFDIIMPESEFKPYKKDMIMQRKIMGRYFFSYFQEAIMKYAEKLSILKLVAESLIEDMRLFLIDNLWLPDEDGKIKLSVIETVSYERAMSLFGNPRQKNFTNMENGQKIHDLLWAIDEQTKLLVQYKLIDKIWILQNYKIE